MKLALAVIGAVVFCFVRIARSEVILVKDGQPQSVIVISSNPKKAAQLAAFELQHHLKLITGATVPIVKDTEKTNGVKILVGQSRETDRLKIGKNLTGQTYLIKFLPGSIVLLGKDKDDSAEVKYGEENPSVWRTWPGFFDQQGTLYAVYEFLEKCCGVRWFNPTDTGTFYPSKKTLAVKASETRKEPFFLYREVYPGMTVLDRYDWSVSGLWKGTFNAEDSDYQEWEKTAYQSLREKFTKANDYQEAKRYRINLFLHRMRVGGEKRVANHSLYHYYKEYPPEKYPEIWAKGYEGTPVQLCYTSEKLIELVSKEAEEYFKLPEEKRKWGPNVFAVEPMDNRSFCRCDKCQELIKRGKAYPYYSSGDHSEYHFNFVNEIARRLKKTNPDKMIITLAYASHAKYPETIKLEPNIEVMFCFAANRSPFSQGYQPELTILKEWVEKSKKDKRPLSLWLYYTFPKEHADSGNFYCFPGFFAHTIDHQFKFFHQSGIRGVFHCGYGQEVEAYVTYRLMLDPKENIEQILNEYFSSLYGQAAQEMKDIYLLIEQTYTDQKNHPEGVSLAVASYKYQGTKERMEKIRELMAKARSKAKTDTEKRNIELFDLAIVRYMEKGYQLYQEAEALPQLELTISRTQKVQDIRKINWSGATRIGPWYERGTNTPTGRKLEGAILHDGENLYLQLVDYCEADKLQSSSIVFPADDWEIFVAKQRGLPYRQISFSPKGLIVVLSHGEINFRRNVTISEHGIEVWSVPVGDRWSSVIKIPFKDLALEGYKPGEKVYLNIVRVSSGKINKKGTLDIETLVPFSSVHQLERLAELRLAN
ncbi:MAG: DUF4838 domain-containing protein [Candidatus Omnitrophica bacterium]|nr:DUF4838 domain-containing protein [Candidatus Omnitrophota bacterium]